jgi:hypothetical protein
MLTRSGSLDRSNIEILLCRRTAIAAFWSVPVELLGICLETDRIGTRLPYVTALSITVNGTGSSGLSVILLCFSIEAPLVLASLFMSFHVRQTYLETIASSGHKKTSGRDESYFCLELVSEWHSGSAALLASSCGMDCESFVMIESERIRKT